MREEFEKDLREALKAYSDRNIYSSINFEKTEKIFYDKYTNFIEKWGRVIEEKEETQEDIYKHFGKPKDEPKSYIYSIEVYEDFVQLKGKFPINVFLNILERYKSNFPMIECIDGGWKLTKSK